MQLSNTNLWHSKAQAILVTTNATITAKGNLVMGMGAAYQCLSRFPTINKLFADCIQELGDRKYGVVLVSTAQLKSTEILINKPPSFIGAFQVKYSYWEKADLDLIEYSVETLIHYIKICKFKTVAINFPGIGNGRLDRDVVIKIINKLPDIVTVHEGDF